MKIQHRLKTLIQSLSGLGLFLGISVIIGWYTGNEALTRISPSLAPMQFNTALGFILSSCGVLLMLNHRYYLSILCGSITALLGLLVLTEHVFLINLGVDQFFIQSAAPPDVLYPGRMAPNTALSFTMIGSAIVLFATSQRRKRFALTFLPTFLATIPVAIGLITLAGYVANIQSLYGWGNFIAMALHTAIGFTLIGSSLIAYVFFMAPITERSSILHNNVIPYWLALLIAFVGGYISFSIAQSLYYQRYKVVKEEFRQEAQSFIYYIQNALENRQNELVSIRSFFNASDFVDPQEFHQFTNTFIQKDDTKAIVWAPYVPHKQLKKFVAFTRNYMPGFKLHTDKHNTQKGYFPFLYIAGSEEDQAFLPYTVGDDLLAGPYYQNLISTALKSKDITVGLPPVSADALSHNRIVMVVPVYHYDASFTPASKSSEQDGMLLSFYALDEIVASAQQKIHSKLTISLKNNDQIFFNTHHDDNAPTAPFPFLTRLLKNDKMRPVTYNQTLTLTGQRLEATVFPDKQRLFFQLNASISILPLLSLLLTLMICCYYILFTKQHLRLKEEKTKAEEQKKILDIIIANIPLSLSVKDAIDNYKRIVWNQKAEETFKLFAENVIGKTDFDIFSSADAEFLREADERAMKNGQIVDIPEEAMNTADKAWIAHIIKVPIYDKYGNPKLLLEIIEDVTERIEAEIMIRRAMEQSESANRAKTDFLANMSHELRTPLNSIIGMTELLVDTRLNKEQREMTHTVMQASEALKEIVNDILDISKIEAGEFALDRIGFDIQAVFTRVLNTLQPLATQKNLSLTHTFSHKMIPFVKGDPVRFARILTNLVSNGIKYTDEGCVEIKAKLLNKKKRSFTLRCEIIDTGIGIPHNKLDTIFNKFVQADVTSTRRFGGTGLGLTITKQLVEMMGGKLGVESTVGKGSTFWFTLPFSVTDALGGDERIAPYTPLVASKNRKPTKQARILIAEDHPLNVTYIKKLIKKLNFKKFDIVGDGEAVLEQIKEENYDAILMDCHMPKKNGYETTLIIRALEAGKKHIPVIAITANAMSDDRDRCLAAGMDDYLSKPIAISEFCRVLGRWFSFPDTVLRGIGHSTKSTKSPPVNLESLRSFADGNKDTEKQYVEIFLKQSVQSLSILESHCIDGESTGWKEAAHKLKGGALAIGAGQLATLCAKAQNDNSASQKDKAKIFQEISEEYQKVQHFLEESKLC